MPSLPICKEICVSPSDNSLQLTMSAIKSRLCQNQSDLWRKIEKQFVLNNGGQVKQVDCVIGAIYELSFNHYLKRNGLSQSDLDEDNRWALYRKLYAWPSQSRFVFSLTQMLDAYETVGASTLAPQLMTQSQIEESQKRTKLKRELWTLLGETPKAQDAFQILAHDHEVSQSQLCRLRALARALRLVLFQKKIVQYRQTDNFLALLRSANRQTARKAFENCVEIVPFGEDFLADDLFGDSAGADADSDELDDGKERQSLILRQKLTQCQQSLLSVLASMQSTADNMKDLREKTKGISEAVSEAAAFFQAECNRNLPVAQDKDALQTELTDFAQDKYMTQAESDKNKK